MIWIENVVWGSWFNSIYLRYIELSVDISAIVDLLHYRIDIWRQTYFVSGKEGAEKGWFDPWCRINKLFQHYVTSSLHWVHLCCTNKRYIWTMRMLYISQILSVLNGKSLLHSALVVSLPVSFSIAYHVAKLHISLSHLKYDILEVERYRQSYLTVIVFSSI